MTSDELKNHIAGALIVTLSVESKRGAQSLATAIDELIQYRINEALNEPQPEPRFAVGTRQTVAVTERVRVKMPHELNGEIGKVTLIDDTDDEFPVCVKLDKYKQQRWFKFSELEPLPAEPAALPEGVTRDADTDYITYSINVDAYENFVLRWNFETKLVSIMPHSDIVIAELSELKAIVAAAKALIAEIEAQS